MSEDPTIIFFATYILGGEFAELVFSLRQIPHLKWLGVSLEGCLTTLVYVKTFFTFQVASSQNVNKSVLLWLFLYLIRMGNYPELETFPQKCREKDN